jgi:hypothetical protein
LRQITQIVVLTASMAWGQFGIPTTGFLHEPATGAIRPVIGLPGAWTLAPELELPRAKTVRFARHGNFALLSMEEGVSIALGLGSGGLRYQAIEGTQAADVMVLSRQEDKALLISTESRQAQWIEGLPGNPHVSRTVSLPALGTLAVALSWDGNLALAASRGGDQLIYRIPLHGDPEVIGNGSIAAITFALDSADAYLVDTDARQLLLAPGGRSLLPIGQLDESLGTAVSLEMAAGKHLLLTSRGAPRAACFDLNHHSFSAIDLPETATHLQPFGSENLFVLGDAQAGQAVYSLSLDDACGAALYFIPPVSAERAE